MRQQTSVCRGRGARTATVLPSPVNARNNIPKRRSVAQRRRAVWQIPATDSQQREILWSNDIDADTWFEEGYDPATGPEAILDTEMFRQCVSGFFHEGSGLRTVVHEQDPKSWETSEPTPNPYIQYGRTVVRGTMYHDPQQTGQQDKNNFAGTFLLYLQRDVNRNIECHIGGMSLRRRKEPENDWEDYPEDDPRVDQYLGKGFGRAFHQHLETQLGGAGVDYMTLNAVSVGTAAWASLGYEFDPRHGQQTSSAVAAQRAIADKYLRTAAAKATTPEQQTAIAALAAQPTVTPQDIVQLDQENSLPYKGSERTWLGKEALSGWYGVKFL